MIQPLSQCSAKHAADFGWKCLMAGMIVSKAIRIRQKLDDEHVPVRIIADQPRHQSAERGVVAGKVVTSRLALEREHGVGLHVAHLLDEEAGPRVSDHLKIAVRRLKSRIVRSLATTVSAPMRPRPMRKCARFAAVRCNSRCSPRAAPKPRTLSRDTLRFAPT
jgi:hypothetical protein